MNEIKRLREEKNAIILAHYYTLPEVQEIADFVGDSLALARKAASTDASIILFAGVHFMAETAKILNPDKKVLVPDMSAGCCLADSCLAADLARFKEEHPDYLVLSYVNCSAAVKALSDLIVTSGNALKLVNTLPKDAKILFTPDQNLGDYINRQTGRQMLLWDGMCRTALKHLLSASGHASFCQYRMINTALRTALNLVCITVSVCLDEIIDKVIDSLELVFFKKRNILLFQAVVIRVKHRHGRILLAHTLCAFR